MFPKIEYFILYDTNTARHNTYWWERWARARVPYYMCSYHTARNKMFSIFENRLFKIKK